MRDCSETASIDISCLNKPTHPEQFHSSKKLFILRLIDPFVYKNSIIVCLQEPVELQDECIEYHAGICELGLSMCGEIYIHSNLSSSSWMILNLF